MKCNKAVIMFFTLPVLVAFMGVLHSFASYDSTLWPEPVQSVNVTKAETFRLRKTASAFPKKYSSVEKGNVTEIKNQKNTDLCWCFAGISCCESSLITQGICNNDIDLSERHLAYSTFMAEDDPAGNCSNDYTKSNKSYQFTSGNEFMTMMSLGAWKGALKEVRLPFSDIASPVPGDIRAFMSDFKLRYGYIISSDDVDHIKKNIMEYGSVATGVYYSDNCYNKETHAAYSDSGYVNHAVTIVGWDDDFSKEKFLEKSRPEGDGAWLVKNSFGKEENDNGYYWLSYYDESLASFGNVYVYVMTDEIRSNNNYMYDGTVRALTKLVYSGGQIANVFTVNGCESIDYVSFVTHSVNLDYKIDFYKLDSADALPDEGTKLSGSSVTGKTSYAGYYVIPLENTVLLEEGETFSAVITFESEQDSKIRFYVDQSTSYPGGLTYHNEMKEGQSYIKMSPSSSFKDTFDDDYTPRIKVFTSDYTEPEHQMLSSIILKLLRELMRFIDEFLKALT